MMKYRVLDLFCGAGGFSLGFKQASFKIVMGIDNFEPVAKTFKYNFKEAIVLVEDIKEITAEDILSFIDEPDVIIGSPPCEPFTAANPNRLKDPLDRLYVDPIGRLVLDFIRIVGSLKPKVFIMENVPQLAEGPLKKALIREFKRVGYERIYFNMLKAEDYGTPSHRLRLFISNIPLEPQKLNIRVNVEKALAGLPPPNTEAVPNHTLQSVSDKKLRKISLLSFFQ